MPTPDDQDVYLDSESSFYQVLHQARWCLSGDNLVEGVSPVASGSTTSAAPAGGSPQCCGSWDINYLPTTVRGVWLYLCPVSIRLKGGVNLVDR